MRDTESRYWEHMTPACMTEESDAENAEKIVTHQLLWRSECEFVHEYGGGGGGSMYVFLTKIKEWGESEGEKENYVLFYLYFQS